MNDRYSLRVTVTIERRDEHGGFTGDRLNVNEECVLHAASFDQISAILGRFHSLNEDLKTEGLLEP